MITLQDEPNARPVDVIIDEQRSLLIIDDDSNSIWRVRWT
jgi:glucose/arabinose dehydrogenase